MGQLRFLKSLILSCLFPAMALAEGERTASDLEERVEKLEEKAVESDNKKLYIFGHINRGGLWLNNGVNSNLAWVDGDNSDSRLGIHGEASFNDDLSVGGLFVLEMLNNSSATVDVHDAESDSTSQNSLRIRTAELFFTSKTAGEIRVGRGDMASNNTMEETDLSKTLLLSDGASGPYLLAGGATFTAKGTGAKYTSATVGNIFNSGDGLSRKDRILYNSPKYKGFWIATSHAYQNQGNLYDVALKFSGKFADTAVAAEAALSRDHSNTLDANNVNQNFKMFDGSIGVLFPLSFTGLEGTGTNLFFGTAQKNWDAEGQPNGHVYFGKVGLIERIVSWGETAFSVDLGTYRQMAFDADPNIHLQGDSWGLSIEQQIPKIATEVYAGYRSYGFKQKNSGVSYNHLDAVMVGARVKL